MIEGAEEEPSPHALSAHTRLGVEAPGVPVSGATRRYLRLGELVKFHSRRASVVFVTMPVPRGEGEDPRVCVARCVAWRGAVREGEGATLLRWRARACAGSSHGCMH